MVVVMLRPGEACRNEHRAGVAEIWGRIAEVSSGKGRVLVDVGGVPRGWVTRGGVGGVEAVVRAEGSHLAQRYKTFYGHNLRMFWIGHSVCS